MTKQTAMGMLLKQIKHDAKFVCINPKYNTKGLGCSECPSKTKCPIYKRYRRTT